MPFFHSSLIISIFLYFYISIFSFLFFIFYFLFFIFYFLFFIFYFLFIIYIFYFLFFYFKFLFLKPYQTRRLLQLFTDIDFEMYLHLRLLTYIDIKFFIRTAASRRARKKDKTKKG